MVRFSADDFVDTASYEEAINRLGYIFYSVDDGKQAVANLSDWCDTLANRAKFEMRLRSGDRYYSLTKNVIYDYLTKQELVSPHYFSTRKTQSISLDMKLVLEKILKNGMATEFLTQYMAHRSMKSKRDSLRKLVEGCQNSAAKDRYGRDLAKIPFIASEQVNRRFNYKNYDIISQIPKSEASMIGVEDGYFLAWGDFAQSDFRVAYNLFMRSPENDEIMNCYEDKYEALARIVSKSLGREFDLDKFKTDRKLYKKLTLATVYGMADSGVPEENEFIQMFSQFLSTCDKYVEYRKRISDNSLMQTPIRITSYFGYDQYAMPDSRNAGKLMHDALNMPNQTGTSELVILTVNSILETARECGLSEDQFGLYLTRHDEPIFRIKEDVMEYLWILKKHSTILVDDWTPLRMDFNFGYKYKVSDEMLEQKASEIFNNYKEEVVTDNVVDTKRRKDYYPLLPLLKLKFHYISLVDVGTTVAVFEEAETGKAVFILLDTVDKNEVIDAMRYRIQQVSEKLVDKYSAVFVLNNFKDGEDFFDGVRVRYKQEFNANMNSVIELCRGMTKMYCDRESIEAPERCTTPLNSFPEKLEDLYLEDK